MGTKKTPPGVRGCLWAGGQSPGRESFAAEGIRGNTISSPSLWRPLPPLGHQVSPDVPTPPPGLPAPHELRPKLRRNI